MICRRCKNNYIDNVYKLNSILFFWVSMEMVIWVDWDTLLELNLGHGYYTLSIRCFFLSVQFFFHGNLDKR